MICTLFAVQRTLGAGELVESVFHFAFGGLLCGVVYPFSIRNGRPGSHPDVLGHDAEQEGHCAGAVGQGVEHVEVDPASAAGELEHIARIVFGIEYLESGGGADGRIVLEAAEEPPEQALAHREAEAREAVHDRFERIVEAGGYHVGRKGE